MKDFYKILNKTEEAEILIYGDIGNSFFEDGIGAKQFLEELKALGKVNKLSIRINSGGGSVFDGMAIFNAIDRFSAKKTVYIDGIAASIASVIAMAGETVVIAENATMMIHNPFGATVGDANDMRKMAESLDKIKEGMVSSYKRKSNLSDKKISDMMDEETWMSAKEAVKFKFATEVGKPMVMAASLNFDLSRYKNVPEDLINLLGKKPSDGPEAVTLEELEERFQKFKPEWGTEELLKKK